MKKRGILNEKTLSILATVFELVITSGSSPNSSPQLTTFESGGFYE
ncbi:MAG: hypothetical protein ACRC1D_10580 [Culicoidibacterales bacterium]